MADDEPLDNIDAESLALRRTLFEKYGPHVDLVGLAAIGITRRLWRNDEYGYVEEAHNRITDGEMMAANVATTRLVLEVLGTYPEVDWQTLADALTDPHRVAGRRTAVDLLGKTRHRRWASWARKFILAIPRVIDQHGAEYVVLGLANDGAVSADWWGGPSWPQLVDAFIAQRSADPPGMSVEALRLGLLDAPDQVDPAILDWCTGVQLIGYTRLTE